MHTQDLSHFRNDKPDELNADSLQRLKNLADSYFLIEKEVNEAEEYFKERKGLFNKLCQETIPDFLGQYGLSDIKLKSGEKIKVKEDLSVSISEENKPKFFAFLKERNEDDIIKMQIHFDRMPSKKLQNLISFLNKEKFGYDSKRDVHSATRKKYFKELFGLHVDEDDRKVGIENNRYLRMQDVEEFANVFQIRKTKIKK